MALALVACAEGAEPDEEGPLVVVTTSILGDLASSVVADEAQIEVLIPRGIDPHEFSPSAQQASLVAAADLVVANGLQLEAGLVDVLAAASGDGVRVVELAPLIDPLPFAYPGLDGADEDELDPHFWMDPARVGDAALALGDELAGSHPGGAWEDRAEGYAAEMDATDGEIRKILSAIPETRRKMITNHAAFGYFAARYEFELLGVVIPGGSTLAEPSSARLAELVEIMDREGARVIFAETTQPTTLAEALTDELGAEVEVVTLFTGSLGDPGSGAESLAEMLITNAGLIAEALG